MSSSFTANANENQQSENSRKNKESLFEESVWNTVGRANALFDQVELGISAMSELNGILNSLAKSQSEFASSAIKSIAKKLPALQEKLTDHKNSTNLALSNFMRIVQDDTESVEQEHKFLGDL
jgi:hypothetical protein